MSERLSFGGRQPSPKVSTGVMSLAKHRDNERDQDNPNYNKNLQSYESDEGSLEIEEDGAYVYAKNDGDSVNSGITVETMQTLDNENTKPLSEAEHRRNSSSQVFVGAKSPTLDLKRAINDVTKTSIYAKNVDVTKKVASKFLQLVRGDNRSWEAIAVDILRRKQRWDSIVLDSCLSNNTVSKKGDDGGNDKDDENTSLGTNDCGAIKIIDLVLSGIINVDNCTHLHLTSLQWSSSTSFALQSIMFSRNLRKLQLDLINLSKHVPALVAGLSQNKSLTCLIASRCGLNDDHLGALLGHHLPPSLEEVRIFGNKCRNKGLASLASMLEIKKKTKKRQKRRCNLKILDLSFQHIDLDEEFDIKGFAKALGGNKTLKVLDLDNDSLNDGHLTHIVDALCRNNTLEELRMNHNKITGEGVAMLGARYGDMKGLKKISMYSNLFDD